MKLHSMLGDLEANEIGSDVMHWTKEGDTFVIRNPKIFTNDFLMKYFRTSKFTSFQRQLNSYGFKRSNLYAAQEDIHIYTHDHFHRDYPERLEKIKRKPPKTKKPKQMPPQTIIEEQFRRPQPQANQIVQKSQGNHLHVTPVPSQSFNHLKQTANNRSFNDGVIKILNKGLIVNFPVATSLIRTDTNTRRDIILDDAGMLGGNSSRPSDLNNYTLSDWDVEKEALQLDSENYKFAESP